MSEQHTTARLLTIGEVSQSLQISSRTIWKYAKSGDLPTVRIGKLVRVRPQDLDAFIQSRTSAGV